MIIKKEQVVTIHYTLKDKEGTVIDSSKGEQPLTYIQGIGNIISGLEAKLEGKKVGENIDAVIEPKDAYGEIIKEMIQVVPKSGFEGDDELQEGIQVQVETDNGAIIARVVKIEGDDVTLDLNHPLAGETLFFNVDVVDIRPATSEELEHGHVHGPDGHHHD